MKSGWVKQIRIHERNSELAELIGIVLGDRNIQYYKKGGKVATYSLRIAGDSIRDRDYLEKFVYRLCKNLFDVEPSFWKSKELMLIIHSKKLVEFLINEGLSAGNKIKNEVRIPLWIFESDDLLKACIRGLIDTDGSIYRLAPHYPNLFQLSFKNNNSRLLNEFRKSLLQLNFKVSKISKNQVYITRQSEIRRFYKEIGFSNKKHQNKYSPVV